MPNSEQQWVKTGTVKGIFTDLRDNSSKERILKYKIGDFDLGLGFQLIGGSTGYESFYITKRNLEVYTKSPGADWEACIGTKGKYLQLVIRASEMRRALEDISLEGQRVAPDDDYFLIKR